MTFLLSLAAGARPAAAVVPVGGPQKVAVILVGFTDSPAAPISAQGAREKVFTGAESVDAYYRELSYGKISLTGQLRADGDVFGWYTLNTASAPTCDRAAFTAMANEAAAAQGVSLTGYDHLIYAFNWSTQCGGLGFSEGQAARRIFVAGSFSINDTTTYIHEMGHDFGLWHAEGLLCKSQNGAPVVLSESCEIKRYADIFDPMGTGKFQPFSNWRREQIGILPPSSVKTITESGTYTLRATLYPTSAITSLRIPRSVDASGNVAVWYDLEIRQAGSIFDQWLIRQGGAYDDALLNSQAGVLVRLVPAGQRLRITPQVDSSYPVTALLDTKPSTSTFADAPLSPGQSVELYPQATSGSNLGDGLRLRALTVANGTATVSVTLSDLESPGSPSSVSGNVNLDKVTLSWGPATDNVGVTRYRIFRKGQEIGSTNGTSFFDSGVPAGQQAYEVYAEDKEGNRSVTPGRTDVSIPDFAPPTTPTKLSSRYVFNGVDLIWSVSSDNVKVIRYGVLRDGTPIASTGSSSYRDTGAVPGSHTYVVYAEDAAGNRSPSSASTTLAVPDLEPPGPPSDIHTNVSAHEVTLEWGAAADNVGVARYLLFRDGLEIGVSEDTGFTEPAVPSGTHRYAIYAEDAAGGRSPESGSVWVQVGSDRPSHEADAGRASSAEGFPVRLRWQRRAAGTIVFSVTSPRASEVRGASLWVEGRLLGSQADLPMRRSWSPQGAVACRRQYRVKLRVIASGEREIVKLASIAALDDRSTRQKCRT